MWFLQGKHDDGGGVAGSCCQVPRCLESVLPKSLAHLFLHRQLMNQKTSMSEQGNIHCVDALRSSRDCRKAIFTFRAKH